MAEKKKPIKPEQAASSLVGVQTQPTTLDTTTALDIDTKKTLADNIIEAGISNTLDISALENFTTISNSRGQMYQLIDTMAADSSVSSVVRTYAEDVCEIADNGHIVWCESDDPKVSKYVNYLLNKANVDKNIYSWASALVKYGDVYLRLFRESDYEDELFKSDAVETANTARVSLNESFATAEEVLDESVKLNMHLDKDHYSHYAEMVNDPSTMFELTKFGKTYGYVETPNEVSNLSGTDSLFGNTATGQFNFALKSADVNVYQATDFVHACLEDNFTRFPETVELFLDKDGKKSQAYNVRRGKSILFDNYKTWREKALLENSALLNRITRSSIVRKVGVEVGDMPREQVQQTLRRVKDMMEQKSALNVGNGMTEYNNPGPIENNIYFATHGGQGNITVEAVGGDFEVRTLADLDFWNTKFYSAYGVPKAFFGWTDDAAGFNGGTSLTVLSSIYAKGIKRVQSALIQAITDMISLFLLDKGLMSYLNNFTIKMKAPLTQEEIDYRTDLTNKVSAISSIQGLFTDIEDKPRRLRILKALLGGLNYGDTINTEIDAEIAAIEEAKRAEEEALASEDADAESGEEVASEEEDLGTLADLESFNSNGGSLTLLEDQEILENTEAVLLMEDELPSPADLDPEKDFSENN